MLNNQLAKRLRVHPKFTYGSTLPFFQLLNPRLPPQDNQKYTKTFKKKTKNNHNETEFQVCKNAYITFHLGKFQDIGIPFFVRYDIYTSTWTSHMPVGEPLRDPVGQRSARSPSSSSSSSLSLHIITFIVVISYYGKPCPTRVHCWQGGVTMVNKVLVAMETLFCSNRLVQLFEFWFAIPPHQSTWFVCITCCFSCVLIFFFILHFHTYKMYSMWMYSQAVSTI